MLAGRYDWDVHVPGNSSPFTPDPGLPVNNWPFPQGRPLRGPERLMAPILLYGKLLGIHRVCRKIAAAMTSSGCSVAVSHPSMILYAPPLLRMIEAPRVFYSHEYPRHLYEKGATKTPNRFTEVLIKPLLRIERRLDLANARAAAFHACNSQYIADNIQRIYGRRAVVVRPAVDSEAFTPGGSVSGGFVLSVGAMSPLKGHDLVILALAEIPVQFRPPLVIAADRGRNAYASSLEALASRLGVGLTIKRGIYQERLIESYRAAAVVVCAQKGEPYGLVPLEAMACCKPVIAVREGGFPENVLDGQTGLLVDRDPSAISAAIARILGDPAFGRSLGEAGRQFVVAERSLKAHGEKIASLIDRAAAGQSQF
jgi:glycosyltransferase involved in cell wall biosynthesis